MIWDIRILPPYTARSDNETFAMMFAATLKNCRLSNMLTLSKANEDMVVKDPQKPIATRKEYRESKFKDADNTEKIPKMKLPTIFTNSTFETRFPKSRGAAVILYLKNAPKIAPIPRKINSIPFIIRLTYGGKVPVK
jgi:hypothetical protein